ncbi:hypothetical protein GCM10010112_49900 [Actinoplanes lobatus]|uniref:Uncharacterized protein n=2 Tax=Actinoplanes lobatus TaxID=113568 RepID=A0A7W7HP84_9ACTN|nr:DUF6390 family protein [Actinoplanes lobatus]MBB4754150.1 hypothetical protein [Actinoplanes lobatus]GGN77114.1 hypothetical protein GCM10010112_49900 [Actinoplanes lobatus]
MSDAGATLFARYAFPPNELGYCGPDGVAPAELGRRARDFEGAWAYLCFIASSAGIADPLDERVVAAYWLGGTLLDLVDGDALADVLRSRFAGQYRGSRAMAHHSFHVFEVYPWLSLLRRTGSSHAVSVLDRCRIRTGMVSSIHGLHAVVRSPALAWRDGTLAVGDLHSEQVRWERSLLPELAVGDRVTLHWDWVCDVVTQADDTRLRDQLRGWL